ncbi:non-hydrolyzing UDP-N-acetylglucosamine 2-epimerase [Methanoculleus receptaculi]|uniref:UDP-N-acetylglucosamine 2-epimerase (Non-hydrolyzing) n=1 Tax=Methanoculleus receptaculi TaxID=394967 RepID=A0AAX4FXB3_9EURY|nr:UDP-N-acetylglucosamine 2-epimerase (non-hydrolyzing) [Methanoculleus receptaculi]WOX58352.1 UDP-N-acetylglucosamine 2-epimerase (non-hydrolyzing) [Methanoculleus receptaculi]
MSVAIILGTRPEIIKMSPIIREYERRGDDYFILHTGQHYSYSMDRIFFEQLRLPDARYNLNVGSGLQGEQTGKMLGQIERVLIDEKPHAVLVQGDTNTVLAGALAAVKLHIPVGHVEAGLRSNDRRMPEEINRITADHVSDYLFAPTGESQRNLRNEGISKEKIFVCGNTVVDALFQNLSISEEAIDPLKELGVRSGGYFLVTAHRQENVDDPGKLSDILEGLERVATEYAMPVIYPMHPRTKKMMEQFRLQAGPVRCIEPLDYLSFLQMEKHAGLILTDSGGVQEEACILRVPCATLRENTERPETVAAGANILVGTDPGTIMEGVRIMMERERVWQNPYGDGTAGRKIVEIVGLVDDSIAEGGRT